MAALLVCCTRACTRTGRNHPVRSPTLPSCLPSPTWTNDSLLRAGTPSANVHSLVLEASGPEMPQRMATRIPLGEATGSRNPFYDSFAMDAFCRWGLLQPPELTTARTAVVAEGR